MNTVPDTKTCDVYIPSALLQLTHSYTPADVSIAEYYHDSSRDFTCVGLCQPKLSRCPNDGQFFLAIEVLNPIPCMNFGNHDSYPIIIFSAILKRLCLFRSFESCTASCWCTGATRPSPDASYHTVVLYVQRFKHEPLHFCVHQP